MLQFRPLNFVQKRLNAIKKIRRRSGLSCPGDPSIWPKGWMAHSTNVISPEKFSEAVSGERCSCHGAYPADQNVLSVHLELLGAATDP
jgi:hypothetical protein